MIQLTERERMLRVYRRQEIDRIPMLDQPWAGTLKRWHNEGLPAGMECEDHFGFHKWIRICPDNSPRFPHRIIEETERYRIETTPWGGTHKVFNIPTTLVNPLRFGRWLKIPRYMLVGIAYLNSRK